ncbi:Uncharacterised protein [Neisseria zoodegmatis]|uniref:Uncharacterized protein n=1 Tax=Neisseria zoodegmatis TaxID=326523 RepID=A0A378WGS7_9NEIS|nr:hypothetical protein [Neisseria zoodegmatis]SUA36097.1 Uncharacterised protein [Neisseria zoodegmatis]
MKETILKKISKWLLIILLLLLLILLVCLVLAYFLTRNDGESYYFNIVAITLFMILASLLAAYLALVPGNRALIAAKAASASTPWAVLGKFVWIAKCLQITIAVIGISAATVMAVNLASHWSETHFICDEEHPCERSSGGSSRGDD